MNDRYEKCKENQDQKKRWSSCQCLGVLDDLYQSDVTRFSFIVYLLVAGVLQGWYVGILKYKKNLQEIQSFYQDNYLFRFFTILFSKNKLLLDFFCFIRTDYIGAK